MCRTTTKRCIHTLSLKGTVSYTHSLRLCLSTCHEPLVTCHAAIKPVVEQVGKTVVNIVVMSMIKIVVKTIIRTQPKIIKRT